jgi:hypothetical protein
VGTPDVVQLMAAQRGCRSVQVTKAIAFSLPNMTDFMDCSVGQKLVHVTTGVDLPSSSSGAAAYGIINVTCDVHLQGHKSQ